MSDTKAPLVFRARYEAEVFIMQGPAAERVDPAVQRQQHRSLLSAAYLLRHDAVQRQQLVFDSTSSHRRHQLRPEPVRHRQHRVNDRLCYATQTHLLITPRDPFSYHLKHKHTYFAFAFSFVIRFLDQPFSRFLLFFEGSHYSKAS